MHYRAYFLKSDGHIGNAADLDCLDDWDAGKQVAHLLKGHDIEVWQGTRKVLHLKSSPPPAPFSAVRATFSPRSIS